MQVEVTHAADEHISYAQVKEPPEYVHGGGRKPFAGRLGERSLEGAAHQATDEMRDGVDEKSATEKIRKIV
jgi:hypothetical protein